MLTNYVQIALLEKISPEITVEQLRGDISLLTRISYANFDIDVALCYNRILMLVTSLSGKKYEVYKKTVYMHAATLEEAEYKLKLSLETSITSYRHYTKFLIHRTG